ncbi:MAG: RNA polymerase sigma factor [Oscillospiraceae bacterium]|nr:RNA polymerase sigma factor [Oscillospiraceae bacterium]
MQYDIESIYKAYYKDVYRYVQFISFDKQATEDVVQNTFLKAMQGIAGFREQSSLKTWLLTIARNESIRYAQKQKKYTEPISEELVSSINIENIACNHESTAQVISFIKNCTEPKRSLMILRLIDEMSFVEIGTVLEKSDTWCRVTFLRAKNELLKQLEGE